MYPWPARPETDTIGRYINVYGPTIITAMLAMFTPGSSSEQWIEWERQIAELFDPEKGGEGLHWRFYAVCGQKESSMSKF